VDGRRFKSVCKVGSGEAKRVESRQDWGSGKLGGREVKRVQQAQPIWEAQSSEEGSSWAVGGKMRRR
jgi:hypothetical protein